MIYQLDRKVIYQTAKENTLNEKKLAEIYLYQAQGQINNFDQAKEALNLVIIYNADQFAPYYFQQATSFSSRSQFKELDYFISKINLNSKDLLPYFIKKIQYSSSLTDVKNIWKQIQDYQIETEITLIDAVREKNSQLVEEVIPTIQTFELAMEYYGYDLNQKVRSQLDVKIDTLGSKIIDQCQNLAGISNLFNKLPNSLEAKAIEKWSSFSQKEIDQATTIYQMMNVYANTPPNSKIRKIAFGKMMTMLQDTLLQLDSPTLFKGFYEMHHSEEIKKIILKKWIEKSETLVDESNSLEMIKKAKVNLPPDNQWLKDKAYCKWSLFFQAELDQARNLKECLALSKSVPPHDDSEQKIRNKVIDLLKKEIDTATSELQIEGLLLLFKGNKMFIAEAKRIINNKKTNIILQKIEEKQDLSIFFNYYQEIPYSYRDGVYYRFNNSEVDNGQIEYFSKLITQITMSNIHNINDLSLLDNLFSCSLIKDMNVKTLIFEKIYYQNNQ